MGNGLLSEDVKVIAENLRAAIDVDSKSKQKKHAREGVRYYEGKNDILNNRIFYIDDNGEWKEDRFASNVRIPHGFFTEIVDQKTQYLLSNPIEFEACNDDETFQEYLDEYYDEDFQQFMQDILDGASQKGFEYAYARTTSEDKLTFQVADSIGVFPVYDDDNEIQRIVRYYLKPIIKNGEEVEIIKAEVWDDKQTWFFESEGETKAFAPDASQTLNPKAHIIAVNEEGKQAERDYGQIPFYRLQNNKLERTDLHPIKDLIDDYDLMNAYLSNNLQDFTDAIYVVKGFMGDDLAKLRQNIKAKKTVGVSPEGSVDVKTIEIPVEGRMTKMNEDRQNIYKFGMAFDSAQIGDGNITNIVIKSRYSLLDLKANKAETRLRSLLKWINSMVVDDINRRYGTGYDPKDVEFEFKREIMVNENDLVKNEHVEAQTRQVVVETILAAAVKFDDETILKLLCEQFDIDWEDVQDLLNKNDFGDDPFRPTLPIVADATVPADAPLYSSDGTLIED